ncbi:hypothetical protein Agub_g7885 [Astrephomene gubernaculifera]|uniref:Uncharacterized protein n=1 Tax=Astrephomene gubernaculifera TaxID=47775 RepID=A0AAD3DQR6_9CHLO|nr:hypothetical protein Agub_g7885 [Astrephomene gubernaculifera]
MGCGASSSKGGAPTAIAPSELKTGSVSTPQKAPQSPSAAAGAASAPTSPAPATPPAPATTPAASPPPATAPPPAPQPAAPAPPSPSPPSATEGSAPKRPPSATRPASATKQASPPAPPSPTPAPAPAPAAPAAPGAAASPARPASAPNARPAPSPLPAPRVSDAHGSATPSAAAGSGALASPSEPPLGRLPPLPGASSGPAAVPPPKAASAAAALLAGAGIIPAAAPAAAAADAAAAPAASPVSTTGAGTTDARPALQVPRLSSAPLSCLVPPQQQNQQAAASSGAEDMPPEAPALIQQLASGGAEEQRTAAAALRQLLCGSGSGAAAPPGLVQALLDAGLAAALVRGIKEGPPEAQLDAAWALTNVAASPDYSHAEALCNEAAPELLVQLLEQQRRQGGGGSRALQEQLLWGLANIAGAINPDLKTQALAVEVLDVGALPPVLAVLEAETEAAEAAGAGPASSLMRTAAWCLHNLAKHKREKEMVDAIPLVTRLLLGCGDGEVLTCAAWVLAYLGSNEDNKSHIKQALAALPRLVQWVRDANSSLATPSLLSLGTMCTGYMRSLDYSGDVVDAGGVSAMMSYLQSGSAGGRRDMVKEALFALSNVAGANTATVRAMLDEGAFPPVLALLAASAGDEEILTECLYVLTNPWDPLVGTEVACVQQLVSLGILHQLHALLLPEAPPERLGLLLKGLADGLKRGQQLMTHEANMRLVTHGREAAAAMPPPANPVVELYVQLGTVGRIEALNGHPDEEVATRANGILTVLKFFMA